MWYHYLGVLVALYMVGSAIYSMVRGEGYVFNAIYIVIGIAIGMWAYNGITAPPPSLFSSPTSIVGGFRRRR